MIITASNYVDRKRLAKVYPIIIVGLLGIIFVTSFFIRFEYFLLMGGRESDYVTWADAHYFGGLTKGYLLGMHELLDFEKWAVSAYTPGYSLVLALFSGATGGSLQAMRLWQVGLDSLTILPLFYIGWRLSGSRIVGVATAIPFAVLPLFAFGSVMLVAEALSPFLMATFVALLLWARDGGTWRWAILGLAAGYASLIRPDLLLLIGPIAVWWFFTNRRAAPGIAVLLGFMVPLCIWGLYDAYSTGHFAITSGSSGYALWAGLGQLPNNYGFFVSDNRAGEVLAQHGLHWASPESNAYWMSQYEEAWRNHPFYVVHTILWRLSSIPFSVGSVEIGPYLTNFGYGHILEKYFQSYALFILLVAVAILLLCKRYAAAFLVALPLGYAMGAMGPLYYEPRYIRYAAISYILALPLAAAAVLPPRYRFVPAVALIILVTVDTAPHFPALAAEAHEVASEVEVLDAEKSGAMKTFADLESITWVRDVPDTAFSAGATGLSVTTSQGATAYQINAVPHLPPGPVIVRYRVRLQDGHVAIGILAEDGSRWIKTNPIETVGLNEGELAVDLSLPAIVIIANNRSEPGVSHFTVEKLEFLKPAEK